MIERLTRVEVKLDELIRRLDPALVDYESRLRGLERARWWAAGFAGAVGALAGWLAPLLQH